MALETAAPPGQSNRRRASVRRGPGPPHGVLDAALDRHRRPGAGRRDRAHRRGATASTRTRGIKFETFAERRVRGAMIDALRKDAWPRGVRRQRRELEAAREQLRRELGCEPSMADLAAKRRIRREASEPHDRPDQHHRVHLAARHGRHGRRSDAARSAAAVGTRAAGRRLRALRSRDRVRTAIESLPWREQKVDRPLLLRRSDDEADRRRRSA